MKKNNTSKTKENKNQKSVKIITTSKDQKSSYNKISIILVLVGIAFFLSFIFNPTFFRTSYKNKNISLDIPLFMYFIKDNNNVITLRTWRKYNYIENYFNNYLSNLDGFSFYECKNGKALYYNESKKFAIEKIELKTKGILKEINIYYDILNSSEVCK